MAGVEIRVTGSDTAGQRLAAAASRLERPRDLWDEVGRAMVVATQQRFETGTTPAGTPWPASIRVLTQGGKTLIDTARYRNSITHEASDTGVAWGSNAIQSAVLQFGAVIRAKTAGGLRFKIGGRWVNKSAVTIPARPHFGVNDDDEIEIAGIIEEFVGELLGVGNAG